MPPEPGTYLIAADALLVLHALFVAFVILGLVLVLMGRWRSWAWVRNLWFRLFHLGAILVVAGQAWLDIVCPLTVWEMALRARAGTATYEGAFIAHWVQALLYYDAPPWIFTICYSIFALLVAVSWFLVPPGWKNKRN